MQAGRGIRQYGTLGVRYRDLNFDFLVCKLVLVNPDNARTKSALNVLIFSLSKLLKFSDVSVKYRVKIY